MSTDAVTPDVPQRASVELRSSILRRTKHAAIDQGCTVSAVVERALEEYLNAQQATPRKGKGDK